MKYYNRIMCSSENLHKLEQECFIYKCYFTVEGETFGEGLFELTRDEIENFDQENSDVELTYGSSCCKRCYIKGHRFYDYADGKLKLKRFYHLTAKQIYGMRQKYIQHINDNNEKYKDLVDTIVPNRKSKSLTGFERLRYCNQMDYTMPFMLYVPKNIDGKVPLIIWNVNRGSAIDEGRMPWLVYKNFVRKLKREMKNNPCIILLPMPTTSSFVKKGNHYNKGYDAIFSGLYNKITEEYPVDKDRVYIVGSSNSAAGVWSQLRRHPDRYAAALALMGWTDDDSNENFESIKDIPVWACHAENDTNIPIGEFLFEDEKNFGTDIIVDRLKKSGSTKIKYTRYKKYNHSAAMKFLQKEDWHSWLFAQKKATSKDEIL